MKSCKRLFLTVILLAALALIATVIAYIWFNGQINSRVSSDQTKTAFRVAPQESIDSIARRLEADKLVVNKDIFTLYVRISRIGDDIKAGDFSLSPAMTSVEIAQALTITPERPTAWITIREGMRYSEIIPELEKQLSGKATQIDFTNLRKLIEQPDSNLAKLNRETQQFISQYKPKGKNLEGFLYPDTYNIDLSITEADLIDLLISTLQQKLTEADWSKVRASKYSFYQILTVASMLDREANKSEDYYLVAGIIYRRFEVGMKLDIDATTLYGLGRWKPEPTKSELEDRNNLYNTRALIGLTPTPIGNPGVETIKASIDPERSDYLYYITGKDGKMYYAKDYSEHQRNISRYL